MAGNDEWNWVGAQRASNGAGTSGQADSMGDFFVRSCLSSTDSRGLAPDGQLEWRSHGVKRQVPNKRFPREISVKPVGKAITEG
jgi:hypothetical protein